MDEKEIKRNNKKLKILAVVGILFALVAIGLFVYDIVFKNAEVDKKEENNNNVVKPTPTPEEKESYSIGDKKIVDLLNNTVYYYDYHTNYYKEDKMLVSKIDYNTKMKIILDVLIDKYGTESHDPLDGESTKWSTYTMKKADFEKEFYNYFGEDVRYDFKTVTGLKNTSEATVSKLITNNDKNELTKVDLGSEITFNGENVTLKRLDCCGDHGLWDAMYKPISTITKVETEDGKLYIYEKPAFFGGSGGKDGIYKDSEYKKQVGEYTGSLEGRKAAAEDKEEYLDTYKYTYAKNDNKEYYLVSVEKVENGKNYVKPTPTPTPVPTATPEPKVEGAEKLDVNSDLVKGLYEDIMLPDSEYLECGKYVYYNNENFKVSELTNTEIMELTAKKLSTKITNGTVRVSKDTFERMIKQLFGSDIKYELKDSDGERPVTIQIKDDEVEINKYSIGDLVSYKKLSMITDAEKKDDNIYIYETVGFGEIILSGDIESKVYKTCEYENKNLVKNFGTYARSANDTENEFDILLAKIKADTDTLNKLYTYRFTFESNGNGTYHFSRVDRLK